MPENSLFPLSVLFRSQNVYHPTDSTPLALTLITADGHNPCLNGVNLHLVFLEAGGR
jgi:hypothetical protein